MKHVYVYGASNPEMVALVEAIPGYHLEGFIDDGEARLFCQLPVFQVLSAGANVVNAVCGSTSARKKVFDKILAAGYTLTSAIHPSVSLSHASIGPGVYLQEGVKIQAFCSVGQNVAIHMGSLIGHETLIQPHVFIAHGVNVSGRCKIEVGVYIGAGATLLPGVKIGAWSTVGAGSVVTKDVPPGTTVKGVPAK